MAAPVEKRINTTTTRQLLARAGEFEARLRAVEQNQAAMAAQLTEFLHNWRVSVAAAYAVQLERNKTDGPVNGQ